MATVTGFDPNTATQEQIDKLQRYIVQLEQNLRTTNLKQMKSHPLLCEAKRKLKMANENQKQRTRDDIHVTTKTNRDPRLERFDPTQYSTNTRPECKPHGNKNNKSTNKTDRKHTVNKSNKENGGNKDKSRDKGKPKARDDTRNSKHAKSRSLAAIYENKDDIENDEPKHIKEKEEKCIGKRGNR